MTGLKYNFRLHAENLCVHLSLAKTDIDRQILSHYERGTQKEGLEIVSCNHYFYR